MTTEEFIKSKMHPTIFMLRASQGFSLQEVVKLIDAAKNETIPNVSIDNSELQKISHRYRKEQFTQISFGKDKAEAITAALHAQAGFIAGFKAGANYQANKSK